MTVSAENSLKLCIKKEVIRIDAQGIWMWVLLLDEPKSLCSVIMFHSHSP